jgi:cytochrome o ubiquinol oxidase operon protein cyoD
MSVVKDHEAVHGSSRNYVIGFILSIALTLAAYLPVHYHTLSKGVLVALITTLAIIQFVVQMLFFLHLNQETRPRWRLLAMLFMLIVVGILVFGSLWIMNNLNYNMHRLSPDQTNIYLHNHEGL